MDPEDLETLFSGTPYLIGHSPKEVERLERTRGRSQNLRARALDVALQVREAAAEIGERYELRLRSTLVAESNRIEGYNWSPREVEQVVGANRLLLRTRVRNFIDGVRGDPRLWEALGLYRAHELADEWADSQIRPREFEMRELHQLIVPADERAGRYKTGVNRISQSTHLPVSPADTPDAMRQLSEWFGEGTGDPVLDATIAHAWLTHIHPFDDGNGRLARLLANLALVQHEYPPLVIHSASKGRYFDALAASDEGDILPLYEFFASNLRSMVSRMERPGYVDGLVEDHLDTNPDILEALWEETGQEFLEALRQECASRGWHVHFFDFPSPHQFRDLLEGDPQGNCWFAILEDPERSERWLLWFGYRSRALGGILANERLLPSLHFSLRTDDPAAEHDFRPFPVVDGPHEIVFEPRGGNAPVTVRMGHVTESVSIRESATRVAAAYCSSLAVETALDEFAAADAHAA